jgi:hypothetical protein
MNTTFDTLAALAVTILIATQATLVVRGAEASLAAVGQARAALATVAAAGGARPPR